MNNKQDKNEITNPNDMLKDLIGPAKKVKTEIQKDNQEYNKTQLDDLVKSVETYYNTPPHVAILGIFGTLQRGGTSRNKKSNVKLRISDITFESKIINSYITKANKNFTPRQFARYFADPIFELSKAHDIEGNCYVYIARNHPELLTDNPDEKYWCSDFQADNTNCPTNIKTALNMRYNAKFRGLANQGRNS